MTIGLDSSSLQNAASALQRRCIGFAVTLHRLCSDAASALQQRCIGFAVTLQQALQ